MVHWVSNLGFQLGQLISALDGCLDSLMETWPGRLGLPLSAWPLILNESALDLFLSLQSPKRMRAHAAKTHMMSALLHYFGKAYHKNTQIQGTRA